MTTGTLEKTRKRGHLAQRGKDWWLSRGREKKRGGKKEESGKTREGEEWQSGLSRVGETPKKRGRHRSETASRKNQKRGATQRERGAWSAGGKGVGGRERG